MPELPHNPSGVGFPETLWSKVASAGQGSDAALSLLSRWYRPVILKLVTWYLDSHDRRRHDPEDLTQEFFLHLLEHRLDVFGAANPEKGRFRAWLRTCLKYWLHNWSDRERAQKRGGDLVVASLDESEVSVAAPGSLESEFNRRWAEGVMARADGKLREDASARRLEKHDLDVWDLKLGPEAPSDREIAERLDLKENEVVVSLRRSRRRFEDHLRKEVSSTVSSAGEIDEEITELMRCLGK
ncbi:MAG: hypothetical protein AAB074_22935 [Planctomycetota bacterium]